MKALQALLAKLKSFIPRNAEGEVCFSREKVIQTTPIRYFTSYPDRQLVESTASLTRYLYIYPEIRWPDFCWMFYDGLPMRAIHTGLLSVEWGVKSDHSAPTPVSQDEVQTHVLS